MIRCQEDSVTLHKTNLPLGLACIFYLEEAEISPDFSETPVALL